ncbi:MAG: hypothetical protein IAG13_08645 [Deltaproteobacteria bacterium]|nr:hypothetical protein [Nannocystaceae bacterium]
MKTTLAAVLCFSVLAGCDAQDGETVGPRGGIVMSDDGRLALDVPAGALDEEVAIRIEVVDDAPRGTVGTVYAIEPAGLALLFPAELTYDLATDESDRSLDLTDVQMDDLLLITEKNARWQPLADRSVDVDAQTLSASVLFLSSYAIVSR